MFFGTHDILKLICNFTSRRYNSISEDSSTRVRKRQSIPSIAPIPIPLPSPHTPPLPHPPAQSYQLSKFPSINCSEIDSLDSNYQNRSSFHSTYQVSQENLDNGELGLSLPNYYPDTRYDTDVSITAENLSIYSENDEHPPDQEYFDGNSRSLPTYTYDFDSSLSDLEPRYYESNTFNPIFTEYNYESVSDSCSELNNFDEITINNNKNNQEDPVINKNTENTKHTLDYDKDIYLNSGANSPASSKTSVTIKGIDLVEQPSDSENIRNTESASDELETEIYSSIENPTEDHITLITIDDSPSPKQKKVPSTKYFNAKKTKSPTDIKRQNYLKDLLENNTNTKPIKEFITKNISRAFGDKKTEKNKLISTENFVTTLVENQYHSLPDINASKYLQKCEKIDRKLRKCEKPKKAEDSKNRFVVNIGQHLNIPNQNAEIPVDFEVKISKVPKISKTPVGKANSFAGRNTASVVNINGSENKHFTLQAKPSLPLTRSESSRLNNFATLTKQTRDKFLATFKKDSKNQDKNKIKLPKITEVIEKKYEEGLHNNTKRRQTIRTYTKIDEKPENKYNSCSEIDSLEYISNSEDTSISNFSDNNKMDKQLKNKENSDKSSSPVEEYHEKLGNMRCFWDKMIYGEKGNTINADNEVITETTDNKNDVIHDSPPPKITITLFENMASQDANCINMKKPEPCKIVEVQSKIENVRKIFEPCPEKPIEVNPSLVETNRKIFEPRLSEKYDDKMGTFVKDACGIYENPYFERYSSISPNYSTSDSSSNNNPFESLNPNIVEIIEQEKQQSDNNVKIISKNMDGPKLLNSKSKGTTLIKSKSVDQGPEFDHVRYKVMKSNLFQKNIFANYEKESQFDGLMQYLQDYSFQELLIDNNIVIIEPIRTKIEFSDGPKTTKKITQITTPSKPPPSNNNTSSNISSKQSSLRKHFFYHPIRVNREVNDAELPNPDTVKQVRQFFEKTGVMKKSQSHNEIDNPLKKKTIRYQTVIDPDRDHCSESDASEKSGQIVDESLMESFISETTTCCERQFVSQDVLQKIRECGTCVTYYGGKVLEENNNKHTPLTKAIMEEIKGTQRRNEECSCKHKQRNGIDKEKCNGIPNNCKTLDDKITFKNEQKNKDTYQGIKFKLIKSNSCSSRLELVGTENVSEYRKKFLERQKCIIDEQNFKNKQIQFVTNNHLENNNKIEAIIEDKETSLQESETDNNKDVITIVANEQSPKIVAEEKKIIQQINGNHNNNNTRNICSTIHEEPATKISAVVTGNKPELTAHYIDYKDYEKIRKSSRKFNDMEFESYEVLE